MHTVYNAVGTASPINVSIALQLPEIKKRPPPPWSILEAATHPKQFGERDEAH